MGQSIGYETREFLEWRGLIMSPPDSLDQECIMQTERKSVSGVLRCITARQAGGDINHEWLLRVE